MDNPGFIIEVQSVRSGALEPEGRVELRAKLHGKGVDSWGRSSSAAGVISPVYQGCLEAQLTQDKELHTRASPQNDGTVCVLLELVRKVLSCSFKGRGGKEVRRRVSQKPGVFSSGSVRKQELVVSTCFGFTWFNCFGNSYKKPVSIPVCVFY